MASKEIEMVKSNYSSYYDLYSELEYLKIENLKN